LLDILPYGPITFIALRSGPQAHEHTAAKAAHVFQAVGHLSYTDERRRDGKHDRHLNSVSEVSPE